MSLQPSPDELEISLFGPGYGECVLIHPGDGHWIVVDSCIDQTTFRPIALQYLASIGVNASLAVKQVIATHWHDDHIRGLGEVFKSCKNADFICSDAISNKEFSDIVMFYGHKIMTDHSSGVDEFRDVLGEMALRARESGTKSFAPVFAVSNKCLWRVPMKVAGVECSIHSLSPSDTALIMSRLDIANLIPNIKEPKRSILPFSKNHAAVVLWVTVGSLNVLLGADLEEIGDRRTGWSVILNSSTRPRGKASVFKIPHHGSKNAHHPDVWRNLLEDQPVAFLSPYKLGSNILPTPGDVARICSLTNLAYTTADPPRGKIVKRDKTIEKMIKHSGRSIKQMYTQCGHIRLRARQEDCSWKIDLFDGAKPLCEASAA
ncbi:MAG: MBL fold metallo-hydrolase [Thermodesulfovibrionales bacterium]|jgi:hypothetical protein